MSRYYVLFGPNLYPLSERESQTARRLVKDGWVPSDGRLPMVQGPLSNPRRVPMTFDPGDHLTTDKASTTRKKRDPKDYYFEYGAWFDWWQENGMFGEPQPESLPRAGSLETAIKLAKKYNETIYLKSKRGEDRGYVKWNGDWFLR
jgi:hypothetical protein